MYYKYNALGSWWFRIHLLLNYGNDLLLACVWALCEAYMYVWCAKLETFYGVSILSVVHGTSILSSVVHCQCYYNDTLLSDKQSNWNTSKKASRESLLWYIIKLIKLHVLKIPFCHYMMWPDDIVWSISVDLYDVAMIRSLCVIHKCILSVDLYDVDR